MSLALTTSGGAQWQTGNKMPRPSTTNLSEIRNPFLAKRSLMTISGVRRRTEAKSRCPTTPSLNMTTPRLTSQKFQKRRRNSKLPRAGDFIIPSAYLTILRWRAPPGSSHRRAPRLAIWSPPAFIGGSLTAPSNTAVEITYISNQPEIR